MEKSRRFAPLLGFPMTLMILAPTLSVAAPGTLPNLPLFATARVKPNIILAVDDSGSMDSEVLFPTNDGALWWNTGTQQFAANGALNFNSAGAANGTWKKYVYLFPNGTGTGNRTYADSTNDHYAIPPLPQYAFARSPDYNAAYFNPGVSYAPWVSYGATTFADIASASAPSDPARGTFTFNLGQSIRLTGANQVFQIQPGMVIPKGTPYYDGSWKPNNSGDTVVAAAKGIGLEYDPAVYYRKTSTGTFRLKPGDPQIDCSATPSAANYVAFHAAPGSFQSAQIAALGPDGACLTRHVVAAGEMQSFANWFSYYRKRHLAMRAGVGRAFDGLSGMRIGLFTINNRVNVTMLDYDTQRSTFYATLYAMGGDGGTPNREALKHAGEQYRRTGAGAPITERCQKCATLLFTDGYATTWSGAGVGNADGSAGAPYADSYSNTLADIAMWYYTNDLRTDLNNEVPTHRDCPNERNDCNEKQHMNTYTVALGMDGTIFGHGYETAADAYDTPPTWPDVNLERNPTQIDDLYHAAINGHGELLNARTPAEIAARIEQALRHFTSGIGSASATAFNTATLTDDTRVYLALFNSNDWSGQLLAYSLTTGQMAWDAAQKLDAGDFSTRNIITFNGGGTPFQWNDLSAAQKLDLQTNPDGSAADAATGSARLAYLRGDRSNEGNAGYRFRVRGSRLGDIVDSAPVHVGAPGLNYPDAAPYPSSPAYSGFRNANKNRTAMLYVGANDGMLHGFNASSGEEVFGYVPGSLYSSAAGQGLHYLTDPAYGHRYYVDLTPTVSDVVFDSQWRTVLIGGLRGGGRGYFALDVTDPSRFSSESTAADQVLWEFTANDDPDLGYTFSRPVIAYLPGNRWAAIFGNGLNNTGSGTAKLFIVYLTGAHSGSWASGTDYLEIDTAVGTPGDPNGLSSPSVVDVNQDGVADRVYAGDLMGNMWAFDLSGGGSLVGSIFSAPAGHPITSAPEVVVNPAVATTPSNSPNLLVFFGTGQYLVNTDLTDTTRQGFYGVWDNGGGTATEGDLVRQAVTQVGELRTITDNAVDWVTKRGCWVDLPVAGERVISNSFARGEAIFFNTIMPSTDACDAGGSSWLMSVAIDNCGRPSQPIFDANGDGKIDEADLINGEVPVGAYDEDMANDSSVIGNERVTSETTLGGGGGDDDDDDDIECPPGMDCTVIIDIGGPPARRLSWEEVVQ